MSVVNNFFGHLRTITKHRHMVIKHCKKAGILWQGLRHDLSKYSPTEFVPGVKYYTGTKSPNEGERIDKGYSCLLYTSILPANFYKFVIFKYIN